MFKIQVAALKDNFLLTVCPVKESSHLMEDYSVDTQGLGKFFLGIDLTPKSDICTDSVYLYVPQVLSTHITQDHFIMNLPRNEVNSDNKVKQL